MNDELNPAFHRILPGKRRALLKGLSLASLGLVDAVALAERRRNAQSRRKIAQCIGAADLVVVRAGTVRIFIAHRVRFARVLTRQKSTKEKSFPAKWETEESPYRTSKSLRWIQKRIYCCCAGVSPVPTAEQ